MKESLHPDATAQKTPLARFPWLWFLLAAGVAVILIGWLRTPPRDEPVPNLARDATESEGTAVSPGIERAHLFARRSGPASVATAEEIVAHKLTQFAESRRLLMQALARRHNIAVPGDVERFFAAVASGHWDEIEAAFSTLRADNYDGAPRAPELRPLWPAILDAYGAAQQVHLWPAQKLLDYGQATLESLRPGMVYIGGTDNGRWIPELLNDTSDGERHIILTQNGLADGTYLDYLRLQYDNRLATLTEEDSQRAFQEYVTDAQRRFEHDQQFPDEPKQVRPGENISVIDNKVQVGGHVSVMAINEKLLQALMQKNPDLSFALEESFPFKSTYADAAPLGPIMEVRASDGQNAFTAERAGQSLDYWRALTQQVLADSEASGSPAALKSWSHNALAAANLLVAHNYNAEAEQTYRLSNQLWPGNVESAAALSELLARTGRADEGRQLAEEFVRTYPGQRTDLERLQASLRVTAPSEGEKIVGPIRPGSGP